MQSGILDWLHTETKKKSSGKTGKIQIKSVV